MSIVGRASAHLLSPLSPLTPLSEQSNSDKQTSVPTVSAAGAPSQAESAKDLQAELHSLKTRLCNLFQQLGAKRQPGSRPPSPDELNEPHLEVIRSTRQSILAKLFYTSSGPGGRTHREWHMLAASPDAKKTFEAAIACLDRAKELELALLASLPQEQQAAGLPAGPSGSSSSTGRVPKRRLSEPDLSEMRRPATPEHFSPSLQPGRHFHAELRREAHASALENRIPPDARTELQTMSGSAKRAGELLLEIIEHGTSSAIIAREHADALHLSPDVDYRLVAKQVGGSQACLLVADDGGTAANAAKHLKWVKLGAPVALGDASAVPAWVDGRRIFLHLVRREDGEIAEIGVLADVLHSMASTEPRRLAVQKLLAQADLIDRLYPPKAGIIAPQSAIEQALRQYDVAGALRLLEIAPNAGNLHEVDLSIAARICSAAIANKDMDAICAMLVVQPRSFVDRMQVATNPATGRSMRDEVMELAARMDRPALRKYLKQFPYPYYSKQGDFSIRLNGEAVYAQEGYAGDPISCRDLATAWVREKMYAAGGKVDYAKFSSAESLEALDPVQIHAERRQLFATASKRYLVHLHDFGRVLEQLFVSMEKASVGANPEGKRKALFFVNTDTHVLAGECSIKGDPPVYRVVIYDPNTTATAKSMTTEALAAVRDWPLPELYLRSQTERYHPFQEKIIGVHVLTPAPAASAHAQEQAGPSTTHHNWLVDTSSPQWINRLSPLQVESMLANGMHDAWKNIIDALPQSLPREQLRELLAASSRAIYNKVQVLDFSDTLRAYIRTIGALPMIGDVAKFQLISNASQSADRDDYPTPGYLDTYLDEVMRLPLPEETRVRLVIPELNADARENATPYLHVLAQRLQSDLVLTFLDRVESMPISDANKLRIIAAADRKGRTAITHPMEENMPELVGRFIAAIMRLDVPDEDKAAVIFNAIPRGVTKEQVLEGIGLPDDAPGIPHLLHDAMSKLRIADTYRHELFIPRNVSATPVSEGSYDSD